MNRKVIAQGACRVNRASSDGWQARGLSLGTMPFRQRIDAQMAKRRIFVEPFTVVNGSIRNERQ